MYSRPACLKPFHHQALLSALLRANSILLCTHLRPDGDAVTLREAEWRDVRFIRGGAA